MAARDLDFEEVSVLRERSEALKDGYTSYLQSHPELSQLLKAETLRYAGGDSFAYSLSTEQRVGAPTPTPTPRQV